MSFREVVLEGGAPWGFRIFGGIDVNLPLKISRVNGGGKASLKGLREGDVIASINGHPAKGLTYAEAHNLLKNSGETLKLGLSDNFGKERRHHKPIIHETHLETLKNSSSSTYTVKTSKTIIPTIKPDQNSTIQKEMNQNIKSTDKFNAEDYPDPPLSPISTVSSDVSSTSTLTERPLDGTSGNFAMMSSFDHRGRRKRSRNQRRRDRINWICGRTEITEVKSEESVEEEVSGTYSVDFPESKHKLPKSKSLDDDSVTIEEVNEDLNQLSSTSNLQLSDKSSLDKITQGKSVKDIHYIDENVQETQILTSTESLAKTIQKSNKKDTNKNLLLTKNPPLEVTAPSTTDEKLDPTKSLNVNDDLSSNISLLTPDPKHQSSKEDNLDPIKLTNKTTKNRPAKEPHNNTKASKISASNQSTSSSHSDLKLPKSKQEETTNKNKLNQEHNYKTNKESTSFTDTPHQKKSAIQTENPTLEDFTVLTTEQNVDQKKLIHKTKKSVTTHTSYSSPINLDNSSSNINSISPSCLLVKSSEESKLLSTKIDKNPNINSSPDQHSQLKSTTLKETLNRSKEDGNSKKTNYLHQTFPYSSSNLTNQGINQIFIETTETNEPTSTKNEETLLELPQNSSSAKTENPLTKNLDLTILNKEQNVDHTISKKIIAHTSYSSSVNLVHSLSNINSISSSDFKHSNPRISEITDSNNLLVKSSEEYKLPSTNIKGNDTTNFSKNQESQFKSATPKDITNKIEESNNLNTNPNQTPLYSSSNLTSNKPKENQENNQIFTENLNPNEPTSCKNEELKQQSSQHNSTPSVPPQNPSSSKNSDQKCLQTQTILLSNDPSDEFLTTEEEATLRNFLSTLNIPYSPQEVISANSIQSERSKKRALLRQYFTPFIDNPRYLDIISEEASDSSDKEPPNLTIRLKRGTPEKEPAKIPRKEKNKYKKRHRKITEQKVELVSTKIIDVPSVTETVQGYVTGNQEPETVFIEESSSSDSSSQSDSEETSLTDEIQTTCDIKYDDLTPPPTPEEDELDKSVKSELEIQINSIASEAVAEINNVLSKLSVESSNDGSSSSSDCSRTTSPSTVKLNPFNGSIADVTSIVEDLQIAQSAINLKQPLSLRIICLNFLTSISNAAEILPHLPEILRKLEGLTANTDLLDECHSALLANSENAKDLNLSEKYVSSDLESFSSDVTNDLRNSWNDKSLYDFSRKSQTLPCESRLKATNLDEWLELARNGDKSNSKNNNNSTDNIESIHRRIPRDVYQRQMQYILEKEREIQVELRRLEEEKRKLNMEVQESATEHEQAKTSYVPQIPNEKFRRQMYDEYMSKIRAMEDRKHHKIIKLHAINDEKKVEKKEVVNIQDEFMKKVQVSTDDSDDAATNESETDVLFLMDDFSFKGVADLPKHLQEFVEITNELSKTTGDVNGIWAPGQKEDQKFEDHYEEVQQRKNEPIPTVWTPKSGASSPIVEKKEFRPIKYESPILGRKNRSLETLQRHDSFDSKPPWQPTSGHVNSNPNFEPQTRLPTSKSAPSCRLNEFSTARLPKAQNPTITLLQKAREGHLPKGANYIEPNSEYRPYPPGNLDLGYLSKNEYFSESEGEGVHKMNENKRKIDGIGPVGRDGVPLSLRSEIRDNNQSKWYKKMYDTIHKQKPYKDEYVTVRYKQRRAQYPYISGYISEPEPGAYDSDLDNNFKYATLDRRRTPLNEKENCYSTMSRSLREPLRTSSSDVALGSKLNPGRIENYTPGKSSISDQESKKWWDEVMDVFDGKFEHQPNPEPRHISPKGHLSRALKESGYESDSTLVFRRREDQNLQLSPSEQKEAYKIIQKGGDIPLHGLRKAVPEKPKEPEPPLPPPKGHHHSVTDITAESPRKYVENQVTIHYKTPVRQEIKEYYSEDELAQKQTETLKKIYQEERRRKYLQELQDMQSRRHTDNFIPSQKSPISLNRYDDFDHEFDVSSKPRPRSPEPKLVARGLYNFVGVSPRELTFRKGDLIYVRRQIDKNWYEGELNAMVGLFPVNYVEIVPYDKVKTTPRKSYEGQARAKFNFQAKTHLELSLTKGETVVITRRVDDNWYEGKIGGRRGIFPVSYVDVLIDPQEPSKTSSKPVAAPAAHSMLPNGIDSMGSHSYTPNVQFQKSYYAKPVQINGIDHRQYGSMDRGQKPPLRQSLHVDTPLEPTPYKALYKYLPQNDDELELMEGDKVYVLEKCDDGWFVGSNERTGAFGTFPGNYVDKA